MVDLREKIVNRAERKIDKGDNHFAARGIMATIALAFTNDERGIIADANIGIIAALEARGAEGVVYAIEEDLGNGNQHSSDIVFVAARDGVATDAMPVTVGAHGTTRIMREHTPGFTGYLMSDFFKKS